MINFTMLYFLSKLLLPHFPDLLLYKQVTAETLDVPQ